MEKAEISLSFLAMFHAVITEEISTFKFILQELIDGEQYIAKQQLTSQKCVHASRGKDTKSYSRMGKGRGFFKKSPSCLNASYQKAGVRLHGECLYLLEKKSVFSRTSSRHNFPLEKWVWILRGLTINMYFAHIL